MTLFWMLAAAMVLAAVALLAPTLLRRQRASEDDTEVLNVEIARDRLAELQKAKDDGDLSDEEFAQGRRDLELALAQDLGTTDPSRPAATSSGRGALIASALIVPLITVTVYSEIGSPHLITNPPGSQAAANHGGEALPPITELAEQLRQRMEANPDNAEGWFLLGRTYMRLQNYPQAVKAYEQVVRLMPEEPAGLLSLADAMIMKDGMMTSAKALELLEKALRIDPNNVTALWLRGNAAFDTGAVSSALDYWQRAYPLLTNEPQMQAQLGQRITEAGGKLPGVTAVAELPPIMTAQEVPEPALATPAANQAAPGGGIRVQVALSPKLLAQTEPTDTVFVIASAETGPPMPLAVARHQVAELPLDVTLTDAMAMMPAMKLSAFPRVKVTAKVSKSGGAATQTGDLLATVQVVDSASPPERLQLLIDQVVE